MAVSYTHLDVYKRQEYVRHLQRSSQAVKALYKDLLISVTKFFRDPEAFEVLRKKVCLLYTSCPGYCLRIDTTASR